MQILIDVCLKLSSMIFALSSIKLSCVSIYFTFNKIYTKLRYNLDVSLVPAPWVDNSAISNKQTALKWILK